LYREIDGSFLVAAYFTAEDLSEGTGAPDVLYNMAGLLVRRRMPNNVEEWIKWEVGFRVFGSLQGAEDTPVGSLAAWQSNVQPATHVTSSGVYEAEDLHYLGLAICRLEGESGFGLYRRDGASEWSSIYGLSEGVNAPDFPNDALEVGITAGAFADAEPADLRARIDYVWFSPEPPTDPIDCEAKLDELAPEP
jgi:hypothetical protein